MAKPQTVTGKLTLLRLKPCEHKRATQVARAARVMVESVECVADLVWCPQCGAIAAVQTVLRMRFYLTRWRLVGRDVAPPRKPKPKRRVAARRHHA